MPIHRLLGAYRGIVLNNADPLQLNRLQVIVPDLTAMQAVWAVPLTLEGGVTGIQLPAVQSAVTVEFEEGNIQYPAWINVNPGVPRLAGSLNTAPIAGCSTATIIRGCAAPTSPPPASSTASDHQPNRNGPKSNGPPQGDPSHRTAIPSGRDLNQPPLPG